MPGSCLGCSRLIVAIVTTEEIREVRGGQGRGGQGRGGQGRGGQGRGGQGRGGQGILTLLVESGVTFGIVGSVAMGNPGFQT